MSEQRTPWIRGLFSVLLALGLLAALTPTHARVPNAGSILLVAVVYASFEGGLRVGLPSAALAELSLLGYHWADGDYTTGFAGAGGPLVDAVAFGTSAAAIAILVGSLRRRSEERLSMERDHRRRMAELERVKANFLNVASHELRGPLSVARGYASMLADGSFGPLEATDVRVAVPIIANKLDEMNQLVDSMLDTARLEERRLVLLRERMDLRDLVDRAVAAVQLILTPRHELSWRRPRRPILLHGDGARLSIIITNLLQNAIKYSPSGGVVEVFLAAEAEEVTLTVWDQGLGIAPADLPRLFTRFGRIITPANSHIPGTGLGLYLARELARLHGGDLLVSSTVGHGSSFTLVLPRALAGEGPERILRGRVESVAVRRPARGRPAAEQAK
jgi:signal transduction histidine kinase